MWVTLVGYFNEFPGSAADCGSEKSDLWRLAEIVRICEEHLTEFSHEGTAPDPNVFWAAFVSELADVYRSLGLEPTASRSEAKPSRFVKFVGCFDTKLRNSPQATSAAISNVLTAKRLRAE